MFSSVLLHVSQNGPLMDLLQKEKLHFCLAFRHRSYEALSSQIFHLIYFLAGTNSAEKTRSLSTFHPENFVYFLFWEEKIIFKVWGKERSDRTKQCLVMLIVSVIGMAQWSRRSCRIHSCAHRAFPYHPRPMQILPLET